MRTTHFLTRQAKAALTLALLLLLALVLTACGVSNGDAATNAPQTAPTQTIDLGDFPQTRSPAIDVAQALRPAVVDVRVTQGQGQGIGSGVIYRADGIIVTNDHVITAGGDQPASQIQVTLANGEELEAEVVGRDPLSDLAVLRVDRGDLPAATFVRNMNEVEVGQYAFAIGTPLGLEGSVTMGIVSAIDREVPAGGSLGTLDLIQTDAPISPGNSGGALADARARVIGINVAVLTGGDGRGQNIGFAIPADLTADVIEQILAEGRVSYGYLGVSTTTITPALQQQYDLSRSEGVLVLQVQSGTPAAQGGIRQGDIVIRIGDQEVNSETDLFRFLRGQNPGDEVDIVIVRGDDERTLQVTLGERPSN
jgi:S1-C subfamily serine protease